MVKLDVEATKKMLVGGRYIRGMPTCTLAGVKYDYLDPAFEGSWEYGKWPHVEADVPLTRGGTVTVYGEASRWFRDQVIVSWVDDDRDTFWVWIHAASVRRLTAAE